MHTPDQCCILKIFDKTGTHDAIASRHLHRASQHYIDDLHNAK